MNVKIKNWSAYIFQIGLFSIFTIILIFIEFRWVMEIYFHPYLPEWNLPIRIAIPPVQEILLSIGYIAFFIFNFGIASFSMYVFIFILHVLDSNFARTVPICAFAIDCSLVNLFLFHFIFNKKIYFDYFMIYFHLHLLYQIPALISQLTGIIIFINFFTLLINLRFGMQGIKNRRLLGSNLLTDLIHSLLIVNGFIALIFFFYYLTVLSINIVGFILGLTAAIILVVIINNFLKRNKFYYPIQAIADFRKEKLAHHPQEGDSD